MSRRGIARQIALIEAGRQQPVLTLGNLEPKRDLTDVRDTVRAYVAMMERGTPGQTYNVCSGPALAIGELVEPLVASRARVRRDDRAGSGAVPARTTRRSSSAITRG